VRNPKFLSLPYFFTPKTLKLIDYTEDNKVIVLIDSGNADNFIHRRVAKETCSCVCVIPNFQIMIANGGMIKCGAQCENMKLQMGEYHLNSHMFSIEMGGCEVVLKAKWLCTLGPISMDFKDLYMSFGKEGWKHTLEGLTSSSP
jgi:hypothetical protein